MSKDISGTPSFTWLPSLNDTVGEAGCLKLRRLKLKSTLIEGTQVTEKMAYKENKKKNETNHSTLEVWIYDYQFLTHKKHENLICEVIIVFKKVSNNYK